MDRAVAPKYYQAERLDLILPEKIILPNNVALFWLKDVKDESVKLDISWAAGSRYQDQKLTASFVSKMLMSGSAQYTAHQISGEMDFLGGYVNRSSDKDSAGLSLFGLSEQMADIFEVFSKAFNVCSFPENELEKERSVGLNQFRINSQKVKMLCRRAFTKVIFDERSPYGQVASEDDFVAINREALIKFEKQHYKNSNPEIFLVGNVDDQLISKLENWAKTFSDTKTRNVQSAGEQIPGDVHLDKEGALQSAIRIGKRMFDKKHPDYFKFQVLNTILGGYFGSRLMANIREDKGYTYGIGSGHAVLQDASYFFIATEVASEYREDTVNEVFLEMDQLKNELVTDEELSRVKNYMLGEFLRHSDGPIPMMECFKNIHFHNLSDTYYTDFIQAVKDCSAKDIQELARKYFKREDMSVVTVG